MSLVEFLGKYDPCRAEGRMNYQLRDTLYLPEGASQSMQPFKIKREGSSQKLKPRAVSREPSGGNLSPPKPSGHGFMRQKSDIEKRRSVKQATSTLPGDSPHLSRQKSDSGRSAVKTPDYSGVKGSGYGASGTKPKREPSPGSLKGDEHRRSLTRLSSDSKDPTDVKMKLKREKSGDVLGRTSSSSSSQKARTPSVEDVGAKAIDVPGAKKPEVPKGSPPGSLKAKRDSKKGAEATKSTTTTTRKGSKPATKSSTKK